MPNLFEETVEVFARYNKTWADINWIGCDDFSISLVNFIEVAKQTNYNSGYGTEEVAVDLVITFNDGSWLSRGQYDGSEWWVYNAYPQKPKERHNYISTLANPRGGYRGLKYMNLKP